MKSGAYGRMLNALTDWAIDFYPWSRDVLACKALPNKPESTKLLSDID